jgi:hypothetical protein
MEIKDRLVKQIRRIKWIADRLDLRHAKSESKKLNARLKVGLDAAKARNATKNELDDIQGQASVEYEFIWHPIYARDSERLVARARKYWVRVPPLPRSYTEDDDNWYLSHATGDWYLSNEAEEQLKRDIRDAKRVSYDELRKWATLFFAIAGSVLAFVSVASKQKQPDPCPKNYYRSDSGECAFALQKTTTTQQAQPSAPPNAPLAQPSVQQEKPQNKKLATPQP